MAQKFALPRGWTATTIRQISLPVKQVKPASLGRDTFRYIEVSGLDNRGHAISSASAIPTGSAPSRARQLVEEGDVLFSSVRVYLENIAIVPEHLAGEIASTAFYVVRTPQEISAQYFFYFFTWQKTIRALTERQRGNSPPAINEAEFFDYTVDLPPSAEQARIVSRIEELFSELDKGAENLRRAQAQLQRYRQSVLKAAVTGELTRAWRELNTDRLESGEVLLKRILKARRAAWEKAELEKLRAKGKPPKDDAWKSRYVEPQGPNTEGLPELPEGWVWASIGQLFNVFIGSTPSRKESTYWNGGIPWVSSGEVAFCRIKATKETVSELGYQNSSIKLHPKGTILIAMIGEGKTRGQVAILDIPACHSQNSAAIRVSETPVPPEYIYHYLASRYDLNRKRGQGGNQPALNKDLVQSIPVPLPPLQELAELVDDLERRLVIADVMAKELAKVASSTGGLRQSILKAAFSGKLVPQDPSDEPAGELLKRIAAERAAQGARPARSAAPRAPRKARAVAQRSAPAPAASSAAVASSAVSDLAAARKAAGLSQAQLAERAGINQAYVSQMETGKRAITAEQAAALALALGIEPSALTQA